ncbi:MAG TPA: enoyl-CoA hydratase/isomerase family protein [Hyphomicrobiaceae bacterium]|nr:enoyl-CoA hydratase/isomerase family protein [Hyphomicrobiaceae bacterium]
MARRLRWVVFAVRNVEFIVSERVISGRTTSTRGDAATALTLDVVQRGALVDVFLTGADRRNSLLAVDHVFLIDRLRDWARSPDVYAVMVRSRVPGVFSIGTDLRELAAAAAGGPNAAAAYLRPLYELYWRVDCFTKPIVSIVDGHCAGAAAGIVTNGTHRVGGEGFRLAFPEVGLGLVPQAGLVHWLSRLPRSIGVYLALSGRGLSRADALSLGLLTHTLDARFAEDVARRLAEAEPVDPILDGLAREPGPNDLDLFQDRVVRCFEAESVEEILERLMRVHGAGGPWVELLIRDILKNSPLALKAAHRLICEARHGDLRTTLITTHTVVSRLAAEMDFREGFRAAVVDLDRAPRWRRSALGDIRDSDVEALFRPFGAETPELPPRADLQLQRL